MLIDADYGLMRDIDLRFRVASGLSDRADYSIFYGPLMPSRLLVINANPGGTPDNYRIVDVMRGEHEYIEGRASGKTTSNGAEILQCIAGGEGLDNIRKIQVLNRFFRRSALRPSANLEKRYMHEARPFLTELLHHIQPDALLFGGNAGVALFAEAHGASLTSGSRIMGPNGSNEAVYFQEYQMQLPGFRKLDAYGIYHPSKMNGIFRDRVFPLLSDRLGPLVKGRG